MKIALMASLFVSFGAFAQDCFIRNEEVTSQEVRLSREICITSIETKLTVFGNSKAIVNYTLDGQPAKKEVSLSNAVTRPDGKVAVGVWSMDLSTDSEGSCGREVTAAVDGLLVMNDDASEAHIESMEGDVRSTNDNCHSSGRLLQTITYTKK